MTDGPHAEATYGAEFFDQHAEGGRRTAAVVVPYVLELVRPARVIDVGCGIGTWANAFAVLGNCDVLGIDGDYVPRDQLEIPESRFLARDLEGPLDVQDTFDLAVSLEVAEHLDPDAAEGFVETLAGLAPVVLFSAAIPHQGGVDHRNEQWPSYWAERFAAQAYVPIDAVRPRIWDDERVDWWYAQNTLLFALEGRVGRDPELSRLYAEGQGRALSLVHPRNYVRRLV